MRWPMLALAAILAVPAVAQAAAPEYPYTAYVASDGVTLRSGPGSQYYPCDRLSAGAPVEVYRHDPGGWCAIRPPEGSFSWIAGRYLRLTEPGLAVVEQSRVPARVGTRFSSVRDVIQVRLNVGESVEIVGESEIERGESRPEWFKVAPPAGEFRWIHADFLTTSPPEGVRSAPRHAHSSRGVSLASSEQPAAEQPAGEQPPAQEAPAQEPPPAPAADNNFAPAAAAPAAAPEPLPATAADSAPAELADPEPIDADVNLSQAEPGAASLDHAELDLSIMVAEDASRWRLAPLRREVERVIEDSPSPAVRGRARAFLSKLGRFEAIQTRHFALLGTPAPSATDAAAPAAAGKSSPFDGQGRLTPVVSRKAGAPQFALLNASGEVACFVTAAPGANLRPYLGKQIGITGIRGYMPELKVRHVTARRITVLDPPVWR
jgi:SH3-like domain-containing protein